MAKKPKGEGGKEKAREAVVSTTPVEEPRKRKLYKEQAAAEMRAITGQKPVVTRAKKAIATFKLREGVPIGVMVTLRRERMWEFLDRLVSVGLPRVRDFKGVSPRGFDGQGNYTL